MQGCRARSKFAARILSKVPNIDMAQIDLRKRHRQTLAGRLRDGVHFINEDAYPLIASAMHVDRAALLSCRLDLYSCRSRLHALIAIHALQDQIGMSVVIPILR